MATKSELSKGQQVYFGRGRGEQTKGEIVKVNKTRAKVKQLEQRGTHRDYPIGTVWNVPFALITVSNDRPAMKPRRVRRKSPELVDIITGRRYRGHAGESGDSLFGRIANGLY